MANTRELLALLGANLAVGGKTLLEAGIPAAVSLVLEANVLATIRPINDQLKNDIKDGAVFASSITNELSIALAILQFLITLVSTGAWRYLGTKEWICVGALVLIGVTGFVYASTRFGREENIVAAGSATAGGVGLFGLATQFMQRAAENKKAKIRDIFDSQLLLGAHEVKDGIAHITLGQP